MLLSVGTQLAIAQTNKIDERQQRIKELIEALASPNKPPSNWDREITIPAGYDRAAQQKVLDTWKALLHEGIDAFSLLVANSGDRRYSCSLRGANGDVNVSVGGACRSILEQQVTVYDDVISHPFQHSGPYYFEENRDLRKWWRERQHRTLRELQIEATEWVLLRLKHPSDRELRQLEQRTDEQRQDDIRKLGSFLDRLKASNQPVQPKSIEGYGRMIGLSEKDGHSDKPHR